MKKLLMMLLTWQMLAVLAGCATTSGKIDDPGMMNDKVKCPACGFEFNMPSDA